MKKLVVLLMLSLMATTAFAVVDPDPDMMGIYFDETADANCYVPEFRERWMAYVIVTNPSYPAIDGYEFAFTYEVINATYEDDFVVSADNIGAGVVDGVNAGTGNDYAVGLNGVIPSTPATIVHSFQFLTFDETMTVNLSLGPISAPSIPGAALPIVKNAGFNELMTVGLSTGGVEIPVAVVNGDCPVAVESETWGGVKSLYR